jgi:hypothetical protein
MYSATLDCGTLLTFEARSFVPSDGELVPCRRHGYCTVAGNGVEPGQASRLGRRARPRAESELVDWLRHHRVTTVHALRRQRFTLRMLAAVAAEVLVDVDPASGRVLVRADG